MNVNWLKFVIECPEPISGPFAILFNTIHLARDGYNGDNRIRSSQIYLDGYRTYLRSRTPLSFEKGAYLKIPQNPRRENYGE